MVKRNKKVLITNVRDEQQRRVIWESYLHMYLPNKTAILSEVLL